VYQHFSTRVSIVEPDYLGKLLNEPGTTIFEGAQGVLLDEWYGFYPYNTWSTLTFKNADMLLQENTFDGTVLRLGLTRGYGTRHGAGPFVTEDDDLTARVQDRHNQNNPWQREFRVGYLDFIALRYALAVTGRIDGLVVTNLDCMEAMPAWRTCDLYQYAGDTTKRTEAFDVRGPFVSDIHVPADPTNLVKQEERTRLLFEMRPVYVDCEKDRNTYLDLIRQTLDLPIAITSAGPTALEKDRFFALEHVDHQEVVADPTRRRP
jgi:adenylosuccinate synthase